MHIRTAVAAGAIATALALSGCSGSKNDGAKATVVGATNPAAGPNPRSPGGPLVHGAPSSGATSSDKQLSKALDEGGGDPSATKSGTATLGRPVTALLASVKGPVTTANMPKAKAEWIAAIQMTDDQGHSVSGKLGMSANLAALVDEAAKTSDLDALIKLCNLCDQSVLKQKLTAVDAKGRTGFQDLSLILEKTHPAPANMVSAGWDYPGFTRPQKGAATKLDQADMALLGNPYSGLRAQFSNLNDGPDPYDGWTGLGAPNT